MVIANRAAGQGIAVVWEEYEGMLHISLLLRGLDKLPQVKRYLQESSVDPKTASGRNSEAVTRMRKGTMDSEESIQHRQQSQTKYSYLALRMGR